MPSANLINNLQAAFPDFIVKNAELTYLVAGDFARYLLEQYRTGHVDELTKGLILLTASFRTPGRTRTGHGGLSGDIQNLLQNGVDAEVVFAYLGAKSQKA